MSKENQSKPNKETTNKRTIRTSPVAFPFGFGLGTSDSDIIAILDFLSDSNEKERTAFASIALTPYLARGLHEKLGNFLKNLEKNVNK